MQGAIVIAIVVAGASLMAWWAATVRRMEQRYRFDGQFIGQSYECLVGTPVGESKCLAFVGASREALFILRHPKRSRLSWRYRPSFSKNLRIPWADIDCRVGSLDRNSIWFYLPDKRSCFYVPRAMGEQLLADAGRPSPA